MATLATLTPVRSDPNANTIQYRRNGLELEVVVTPRGASVPAKPTPPPPPIVFEVSADKVRTWQQVQRTRTARIHLHEVHLGKPRSEFLGPGEGSLQLDVRLDAQLGLDPLAEVEAFNRLMETGEVLSFVVGGEVIGDFMLRSMRENWRGVTDAVGKPKFIELGIDLLEYA